MSIDLIAANVQSPPIFLSCCRDHVALKPGIRFQRHGYHRSDVRQNLHGAVCGVHLVAVLVNRIKLSCQSCRRSLLWLACTAVLELIMSIRFGILDALRDELLGVDEVVGLGMLHNICAHTTKLVFLRRRKRHPAVAS